MSHVTSIVVITHSSSRMDQIASAMSKIYISAAVPEENKAPTTTPTSQLIKMVKNESTEIFADKMTSNQTHSPPINMQTRNLMANENNPELVHTIKSQMTNQTLSSTTTTTTTAITTSSVLTSSTFIPSINHNLDVDEEVYSELVDAGFFVQEFAVVPILEWAEVSGAFLHYEVK